MIGVVKNVTDTVNLYTYFEFIEYDSWDDYDILLSVLTDVMKCEVLERLEGPYSRHRVLKKNEFVFKLMYHEDVGNCLCNQYKKDDDYYNVLEELANEAAAILAE